MHDPDVLVITAHPQMEHSRINRRMMRAARKLSAAAGPAQGNAGPPQVSLTPSGGGCREATTSGLPKVLVRDLYALYPDYLIDVAAEQALLVSAKLVVWQHPIQWYSMPPLMKMWVDEVLAFGWAYGPGGTALRGKDLWLVTTTGGPQDSYHPNRYNRYFFDAFLPPYEQTATLCGMRFLTPLRLHGAHQVSDAQIAAHVAVYVDRLQRYPNWPELDELLYNLPTAVPEDARPDEDEEQEAA